MTNLKAVKDLLLPGLWGVDRDGEHNLDITVSDTSDCLLVGNDKLSFAITRQSIEEGRYKSEFAPSLRALVDALESKK